MPVICLRKKNNSYQACKGVNVTVNSDGNYTPCKLFTKYTHKIDPPSRGCIYVYKKPCWSKEYLAISNPCLCLECVHVYYNQHDPAKKPLVLVFQFKKTDANGGGDVSNRYYRMSRFDTDKGECKTKRIDQLCRYDSDSDILCPLIEENDILANVLTYDIMKRTGAGAGNGPCSYNCGKISVTKNANGNGEPKVGAGFTRYKHTPTGTGGNSNGGNDNAGKPACIIYRCQTLVGDGTSGGTQAQGEKELAEIQAQTYKCVSVYFGCIARRNGAGASTGGGACPAASTSGSEGTACKPGASTCTPGPDTCPPPPAATEPTSPCNQDVPLLLELLKNGTNSDTGANQPEYYAHFRSTNGARKNGNGPDKYYWVQLPCGNGADGRTNGDCVLKNLLEDIGLHTKKQNGASHNGHETLKQLLKQALNGNGDGSDGDNGQDLTAQLQKATGKNLTKLLGQPVNGSQPSVQNGRQNGQNTLITLLLKRIEFNVTDSVVVLLDKKCKNGGHNGGQDGQDGSYGDPEISTAVSNLEPNGRGTRVNRLKLGNGAGGGTKITVTDVTTSNGDTSTVCQCLAKCLAKYGYCVVAHDFGTAAGKLGQGCSAGLRLLIPAMGNGGVGTNGPKYNELRLYPGDKQTDPAHLQYLYYRNGGQGAGSDGSAACTTACTTSTTGHTCSKTQDAQTCSRLYVVFYKGVDGTNTGGSTGDPRPLLLCYRGCWYRPKDKNGYFDTWVKVDLGDKGACECSNGGPEGAGANCQKHEKLLCELTKVVGFLNQVNLFQHPKGTAGGEGAQTQCQPGQQGVTATCQALTSGQTTCQALTSGQTTVKCTYEVHQYMGKQVQVQVTCEDVPNTQPSESTAQTCTQTPGSGCYRKLTHRPAGTGNGSNSGNTNNGFRLGDVVYCSSSGSTVPQGSIKYYGNGSDSVGNADHTSTHKWSPLLQVTVYYYNHDTGHCDPLLVELQFAKPNGVPNGATTTEYYRLKTRNGSGGKLVWEKDTDCAKDLVAKPECLTRYLDAIRYCLKKVVRIRLECKNGGQGYDLVGKDAKPGSSSSNGFEKINNGAGTVKVTVCECPALTAYKCYRHCLTEALAKHQHLVAGLAFTLPGRNGVGANGGTNGVVEIPVCVVGQGEAECPPGATEGLCTAAGTQASCSSTTAEPTASTCPAAPASPSVPCKNGQPTGTQIPPVHYNSCMGDVYVYFYAGTNGAVQPATVDTDTVPLMLRYNGQFYRPESRDQYFTKWVPVTALCKTAGECKGGCECCPGVRAAADCGDGADCGPDCPCCSKLAQELDRVNECLNRVDLDKSRLANGSGGTTNGKGYGLPEKNGCDTSAGSIRGCTLAETVGNNRVCLTEKKPTGDDAQKAYTRVVHRTKNGFRIGCLTYCGKDITTGGITPTALSNGQCDQLGSSVGVCSNGAAPVNGQGTTINVANGAKPNGNGHKNLVNENGWNTVVVYYSTSDKCYRLPQLIVLLHTDGPVKNGEAVTGSNSGKKYGYYVLSSANGAGGGGLGGGGSGSTGYAYQWREVNGSKSGETPVKLDDKTDFSLLNAAVILLEQKAGKCIGGTYGDDKIKKAVGKAGLQSPGNDNDVNRLTGKEITVKDETETGAGTGPCACVKQYGFKAMSHDLTPFVKLNGSFKTPLCEVTLITGLKFVIPDSEQTDSYKSVKLCPNGDDTSCTNGERHYYINGNTKICVFFYGSDPRPLILCCNGVTYKPQKLSEPMEYMQVIINYDKWFKDSSIDKCVCNGPEQGATGGKNALLESLVTVVGFLNPVQLNLRQIPKDACQQMTKEPPQSPPGNNTTYELHKFTSDKTIKMKIELKTVDCYGQYTYEPAGVNGAGNGNGFRLGDVMYTSITRTNQPNKLNYYNNGKNISTENKWNPLMKVVVYYYNQDRDYREPLLVILEFKANGVPKGASSTNAKEYYKLKEPGGAKVEWEKETREAGQLSSQDTLIQYLHRLRYQFKKVVKLEVWHNQKGGKYALMGRDGKNGYLGSDFQPLDDKKIDICEVIPCPLPNGTGYKCFKHKLTDLDASYLHQIGGVRFYTRSVYNQSEVELKLYDSKPSSAPIYEIYYNSCMGDIFVFFYDKDPRPLLLCYNREAYHAKNMDDYDNQKWHKDAAAGKCDCPKPPNGNNDALLKALVRVSNFLNPVKITSVYDASNTYSIHWFNMQPIKITVETQKAYESFCYIGYTHTHYGVGSGGDGFRLGDIQYKGKCITEIQSDTDTSSRNVGANGTCISASDVNNDATPKTYKSASEVVVFYYKHDHKLFSPVLVALCEKSGTGVTCKRYYVLKDRDKKVYEKGKKTLDLSNKDKLGEELDRALFNNSKKLQIVLSTRPVATEYSSDPDSAKGYSSDQKALEDELKKRRSEKAKLLKEVAKEADEAEKTSKTTATNALTADKPLATWDALMHHVTGSTTYKAQLSNGASEPPSGPTTTQIPVEEVHCPGLQPGGYRCFKHALTTASGISEVGGLVLRVFAGQTGGGGPGQGDNGKCQPCTESGGPGPGKEGLELCDGQTTSDGETGCKNGETGGKNGNKVELHYTTCKGNLYVFFYGEDPRPLMLCYDKHAYRPVCMADYCKQWVRVNGGSGGAGSTNCMCDDQGQQTGRKGEPKFNTPALLPELFRVSVLLNPVYLRLTVEAIAKLKPKRPDQQSGSADGSSSASGPQAAADDYTYLTHNYPPDPVRVRVTTQDLQCYRRYTHKPEHEGFRLGRVTYAQPPCPEGAGQGTGTVNGPSCPSSPAATTAATTTTPTPAFCFKYASEKQLQTVCTYYYMYDCAHYWPLVVELGFKGRPSEWWRLCSGPQEGGGNVANTGGSGNGGGGSGNGAGGSNGASGVPTSTEGSDGPAPSKPPAQLKWVRMTARPGQTGTGTGADTQAQTGTSTGHTNTGTGTGTGDSCKDAPSTQPAATQPGSNGENCADCSATGTGAAKPAHNGNNNHGTHTAAQTATHTPEQEQREKRDQTCARDAAFARDAREIQDKLGKTVLGIPAYPRNYPGLEIDLRELIERRAYEIRKSLGIEYGPKGQDRLIMETDSNCQEESIMAYLVGGV